MYLGLDLGTSSLKAIIIDDSQTPIASAQQALSVSRPQPAWSEQDPRDWIQALESVMSTLKAQYPDVLKQVRGIGLSGHMHGATLVDKQQQVLRPCMLWNDTRSYQQAAALDTQPTFRRITGNIVFPGFTAPKVRWVQQHEPAIFERIASILLPKDYVRWWLTGELVSEPSDASGTAWFDVSKRDWSKELLAVCDLSLAQMPRLVEGSEVSAYLRSELAKRWGMSANIPIAGGAGDNAASACGMGVIGAGAGFVSLGTSGVLFAASQHYQASPETAVHTFCHAIPQAWHQMGVILSATDALNWYAKLCRASATDLVAALGESVQLPQSAMFLPYLAGERTPHNDAQVRGAFVGLSHEHSQQDVTQVVLEGVAFALMDNLAALKAAGTNIDQLLAVGGGSRSAYWLQLLANIFNVPIALPAEGDLGAAFGAARLGLVAAEKADIASTLTPPVIKRHFLPEADKVNAFQDAYQRYRQLYPLLAQWPPP